MSEFLPGRAPVPPHDPNKSRYTPAMIGTSVGVGAAAVLAAVGGISYAAGKRGVEIPVLAEQPPAITAAGAPVPEAQRARLRDATVALAIYTGSETTPYENICTGTKMADTAGKTYILTARHCFADPEASFPAPNDQPPVDITETTGKSYAIVDPDQLNRTGTEAKPLGYVDRIVVSNASDTALLSIKPDKHAKNYSEVPALPLEATGNTLSPGDQVALSANPQAAGKLVNANGVFLGRSPVKTKDDRYPGMYDIVGVKAASEEESPCGPAGSGSSAIGQTDTLTGPLSAAIPYEKDRGDRLASSENLPGLTGSIGDYSNICAYTIVNGAEIYQLQATLDK